MTYEETHRAIKRGNLASIRQALANLSNKFSWTLLMLAAMAGATRLGELLIERGANLDKMNDFGETALSLAACKGHAPFLELLLDRGASLECHPHGRSLESWLTKTSGLSPEKIATISSIIANHDQKAPERR